MWILTTVGFFSVVRKRGDELLTVRARVRTDLDALRERWLPELGPTKSNAGTDYRYRATVAPQALAGAMQRMALAIDYSNFKNEVASTQGKERAHAYHEVWSALLRLEREP